MNTLKFPEWANPFWNRALAIALALVLAALAFTPAHAQSRFAYSADGSEVTDAQTGLVWSRCTVGQTWSNNTCTGGLTVFTHEEALAYAKTQTGWRLPNVKELASLVDTSVVSPAIDPVAFPVTPSSGIYWSSTPDVKAPASAWSVQFSMGQVVPEGRRTFGVLVRLVR